MLRAVAGGVHKAGLGAVDVGFDTATDTLRLRLLDAEADQVASPVGGFGVSPQLPLRERLREAAQVGLVGIDGAVRLHDVVSHAR